MPPVLYVIACGGRAAADVPAFIRRMQRAGWYVCVVATPSALKFMDLEAIRTATGHAVRHDFKQPDEADPFPPPDALVVAPATFNTVNKMASGANDTLALGILNEAVGLQVPIIAVPTPNEALARHPAFRASVVSLRSWGVHVMFDPERWPLPTPNMGPPAAGLFPWSDLAEATVGVLADLQVDQR